MLVIGHSSPQSMRILPQLGGSWPCICSGTLLLLRPSGFWHYDQLNPPSAERHVRIGNRSCPSCPRRVATPSGGTIENAPAIAAHESPRTTKFYDRTGDEITLDVE